jgi:hypothetical protein
MSYDDESSGGDFEKWQSCGRREKSFFFEEMMTCGTMIDLIKGL